MSLKQFSILSVCLLLPWMAVGAMAQTDCSAQATTELEHLYCTVQQSGSGGNLPSFVDFQRNSPSVQASLLKGPARRLGLVVPKPASSRKAAVASTATNSTPAKKATTSPPTTKPSGQDAGLSPTERVSLRPVAPKSKTEPVATRKVDPLDGCQLKAAEIRCAGQRYQLQTNITNNRLLEDALSDANRFGLKNFSGNLADQSALQNYLIDSYQHYIEKMLTIGLGASTMSYTKFYYTFEEIQQTNEDFASRFETMYGYLKKDKASMAIKTRYTDAMPESINQCDDLSDSLVVCDNGKTNWIYAAQ